MPKLRDVVEMRWDGIKAYWIGTPFTNIPFTLARFKKRVFEGQSGTKVYKTNEELPKGTFYMIVNNGENPLNILLKRKGLVICEDCGTQYKKKLKKCPSSDCTNARLEDQAREDYEQDQLEQSIEEGFDEY